MFQERWNIFTVLSQRQQSDGYDCQSKIEVLPEFQRTDGLLEVPVGGENHAHIDVDVLHASHPEEGLAFEDAEEFGLHSQAHFTDLIQEECSPVGHFEHTLLLGAGVGEGAFLVAEKF